MELEPRRALRRGGRRRCAAADRARGEMASHPRARSGAAAGARQAVHAPGPVGQGAELHRGEPRARAHARRTHDARGVDGADRQAPGSGPAFPPQRGAGGLIAAKEPKMREYSALKLTPLASGAPVAEPMAPGRVTLEHPPVSVVADLPEGAAVTAGA